METVFDRELIEGQMERVSDRRRFLEAIGLIDRMNDGDRTRVPMGGRNVGYELFFSVQLFKRVLELEPAASEALMLAARSQHICRWMIPRTDYPMNRAGYLKWRSDLKKFHATKAAGILEQAGYDQATVDRVRDLNLKNNLRTDPECQTLEDALCLVFLEMQFAKFSEKTDEAKMIEILRKSWAKMSEKGREAARGLPLEGTPKQLVERALAGA